MGTKKNHLIEMVLLSAHNICFADNRWCKQEHVESNALNSWKHMLSLGHESPSH